MTVSTGENGRVSFSDVARAHYRWDGVDEDGRPLAGSTDYDNALAAFEAGVDTGKDAEARVLDTCGSRFRNTASIAKATG